MPEAPSKMLREIAENNAQAIVDFIRIGFLAPIVDGLLNHKIIMKKRVFTVQEWISAKQKNKIKD